MKKIYFLLTIVPLLLTGCSRDPLADFSVSSDEVGIGEYVYFTNRSMDAETFEWDFGDGYVSNTFNASHYYDMDGIYTASLKAYYKDKVSTSYMTIKVIGASITITVMEYYSPNYLVPDISVILYSTLTDWEHPKTAPIVAEKFTDDAGVVRFDHLAPQRYYVDIWGPNHDNYQLAADDVGFIETPVLIPGTTTPWTAFVDYYSEGKKSMLDRFSTREFRKSFADEGSRKYTESSR
jgi:PKD repeat protein